MSEPTKDAWLEGIVQRNDRDLRRYLSQRIGNRAEAEDLSQEIYLRLLRIERKDLIRSPEALLFRVASNAVYEWRLLATGYLIARPSWRSSSHGRVSPWTTSGGLSLLTP
jgi:hypothetical protein